MKSKILFISHNATRTGAPIELLRFLRWLKRSTDDTFLVLLEEGGELESEFRKTASTMVWKRPVTSNYTISRMFQKLFRYEGIRNLIRGFLIKKRLSFFNIGLIYVNTVFVGKTLELLKNIKCFSICRVHESEPAIRAYRRPAGYESFKLISNRCDHFISVSEFVRDNLIKNHGIPSQKISVAHGSIEKFDTAEYLAAENISKIRSELNIPGDSPVIGASGWMQHGKGPDLFIKIASNIKNKYKKKRVYFVWVGGNTDSPLYRDLQEIIKSSKLGELMRFTGHKANPYPYYAIFDILAMTSRSDSFPLINIESGLLGKPVICFDGSGGSTEWVEKGCGYSVPYIDTEKFADKIIYLLENPGKIKKISEVCKKMAEDLTTNKNAPRIYNKFHRIIENK